MMLVRRNNYSNWLNDWFDNCFFNTEEVPQTRTTTAPAINVKETCDEYIMEVAVPGLKKEWVRINVTNEGLLHMAIENKMEHKEEDRECNCRKERHERYLRREFTYGNYEQSYTLPDDVERDKISASVADGILTIVIPKTTPEREAKVMKNIEVK
nr:Hsp20/alpha crystallin family protein [uncultured Prevotella sp.]